MISRRDLGRLGFAGLVARFLPKFAPPPPSARLVLTSWDEALKEIYSEREVAKLSLAENPLLAMVRDTERARPRYEP